MNQIKELVIYSDWLFYVRAPFSPSSLQCVLEWKSYLKALNGEFLWISVTTG